MSNLLSAQQGLLTASSLQGAAFSDLNANFYVDADYGFDGNPGTSPGLAFRTLDPLSYHLPLWRKNNNYSQQIVVGFSGVLRQHWLTPIGLNNVSIVGSQEIPRQATTSGTANGAGATWLSPTSATNTDALIRVRGQGWVLRGIYFNNSATSNGCVQPFTDGDPPTQSDGAHLLIDNCILTGAAYGVYANGGTNYVRIYRSTLFGFAGAGDCAVAQTVGAGVGTLLNWEIWRCNFFGNATNIVMPFNKAMIRECIFANGTAANINLTGGTAPNYVQQNAFNIAAADFDPAGGTTGVTGDAWSNYLTDAVETGLPTN